MPRGPTVLKLCALCKQPCGKYRDRQYAHLREEHGAKALTKSKALEIYPDAPQSEWVKNASPEMSVWVADHANGPAIYGDGDLLVIGIDAAKTGDVPNISSSLLGPPQLQVKRRKTGLRSLHRNLLTLRKQMKKLDQTLAALLEGDL